MKLLNTLRDNKNTIALVLGGMVGALVLYKLLKSCPACIPCPKMIPNTIVTQETTTTTLKPKEDIEA